MSPDVISNIKLPSAALLIAALISVILRLLGANEGIKELGSLRGIVVGGSDGVLKLTVGAPVISECGCIKVGERDGNGIDVGVGVGDIVDEGT